jgi:hypothetical protein
MQEYSITKCTRRCAVSQRALQPGESYFSLIMPAGEDVSRLDIAASHWTEPLNGTIAWWRCKMPDAAVAKKLRPAPSGVLLDTLTDLLQRPGKEALAYLLAVLLMRRRVLQEDRSLLEDSPPLAATGSAMDESATETIGHSWNLVCPADGRQWHVPVVAPNAEQSTALQAELKELLFTEE